MKRRDRRPLVLGGLAVGVVLLGALFQWVPDRSRPVEVTAPSAPSPAGNGAPIESHAEHGHAPETPTPAYEGELHERFQQAVVMLHAGRSDYALAALERVIELEPRIPEAYVNAGFALLNLEQPVRAARMFDEALALRTSQANAYYGLALAYHAGGELDAALGAMRTYVHLVPEDDEFRRKGLAAIWEWEAERDALRTRETATPIAPVDGKKGS